MTGSGTSFHRNDSGDPAVALASFDLTASATDELRAELHALELTELEARLATAPAPNASSLVRQLRALSEVVADEQATLISELAAIRSRCVRLLSRHGDRDTFLRWRLADQVADAIDVPRSVRDVVTHKLLGILDDCDDLLIEPTQHLAIATRGAMSEREVAETVSRFRSAQRRATALLRSIRLLAVELTRSVQQVAANHARALLRAAARRLGRSARDSLHGLTRPTPERRAQQRLGASSARVETQPIEANAPNRRYGPAFLSAA